MSNKILFVLIVILQLTTDALLWVQSNRIYELQSKAIQQEQINNDLLSYMRND